MSAISSLSSLHKQDMAAEWKEIASAYKFKLNALIAEIIRLETQPVVTPQESNKLTQEWNAMKVPAYYMDKHISQIFQLLQRVQFLHTKALGSQNADMTTPKKTKEV